MLEKSLGGNYPQYSPVSKVEGYLIILGVVLSPLWFITPLGVNLTPTDFLVALGGCLYVLRTREYPLLPSKLANLGFILFIFSATISLINTPDSAVVTSVLGIGQYVIIFFIIIPFVYVTARNSTLRYAMLTGVSLVLFGLILATTHAWLTGTDAQRIYLWYGGNQQVFWLVACGGLAGIVISVTSTYSVVTRFMGFSSFVLSLVLVTRTNMITSMLLLFSGFWLLLVFTSLRFRSNTPYRLVIGSSLVSAVLGSIAVVQYWGTLWDLGNIGSRVEQYTAAIHLSSQYFPLGAGLQSESVLLVSMVSGSTSIHNLYFSFLLEVGILGISAFIIYILAWVRSVLLPVFKSDLKPDIYWFPIIVFFGLMLISFVYYPPVRRFWWVLFAISWTVTE